MSHFTVTVVGEDVDEQLAPYHEFECTGVNDEYVQEIDETAELRKQYENQTTAQYKDPGGNLHDPYDKLFYREFTEEEKNANDLVPLMGSGIDAKRKISFHSQDWGDGRGYRAKVHFCPEGWEKIEIKCSELQTFPEFVEGWSGQKVVPFGTTPDLEGIHKYGYVLINEDGNVTKVIDRTNLQKKWDWYKVGGRWTGFFKLNELGLAAKGTFGIFVPQLGQAGIQTMDDDYKPPEKDRADQCLKGQIDIDGMRNEAGDKAAKEYDLYTKTTAGLPAPIAWDVIREKYDVADIDDARKEYHAQPAIKALQGCRDLAWYNAEKFQYTREEYIERARKHAFSTFAVVKDGKWYERGEMGWWGVVHDEKNEDEWMNQFASLIDNLPDDTLLTVVDCHI